MLFKYIKRLYAFLYKAPGQFLALARAVDTANIDRTITVNKA
jgi:hypothetical protein